MANREFVYWCKDALEGIRYWKIRNKVYAELYEHLEDRYEYFLAKGFEPKEAERKTLEAMGDPHELAPQLAAIHKPYWDYAAIATRVLAWALVILTVCHGAVFLYKEWPYIWQRKDEWDPFEQGGEECVAYVEPDITHRDSGYTFRVDKAALWRTYYSEPTQKGEYFDSLYIRMKVTNPIPWMREQTAVGNMWAIDSNGTYYRSNWGAVDGEPSVRYMPKFTGINNTVSCYDIFFYDTVTDIQWMELHYERDGRNMVFHIDLTGGVTQ